MGRSTCEVVTIKEDAALIRVIKVADTVEQAGLSSPIRANYGENLALINVETNIAQGLDTPKAE